MESITPEASVTLVIKTPNQQVQDIEVNCLLDWTVAKLKNHLTKVYPTKPSRSCQKIIYSGKLLDDNFVLKDILLENDGQQQTVHLVCTPSLSDLSQSSSTQATIPKVTSATPTTANTTTTTTTTQSDGLRHRNQHALQHTAAFLQHPYYNMFQHNQNGQVYHHPTHFTPGQPYLPPNVHHLAAAQHMAHMQWMYHMTQIMQGVPYVPPQHYPYQHVATNQAAAAAAAAAAEPAQPPEQAAEVAQPQERGPEENQERNMVMNANAGGGMVQDDDDQENVQRDWLDHIYMGVRIVMLLSIFWFYSSAERLILMGVAMFVVWLVQSGWFQINRAQRNRQGVQNNVADHQEELAQEDEENDDDTDSQSEDERDETDANTTNNAQTDHPGFFVVCYNFVTTFFLSLVPQGPRPVN